MIRRVLLAAAALLGFAAAAAAHELRPAYLEVEETSPGEFSVLWKVPRSGEARLSLLPEFSGTVDPMTPVSVRFPPGAEVRTWRMRAPALRGQMVRIRGLEGTVTDALVRIRFADGTSWTRRLTPSEPIAGIPVRSPGWEVGLVYARLGVEHILFAADHLLFVLGLLLLVKGAGGLVRTVTAFTAAHSVTLAAAALGGVRVPPAPVEATISLSILFLGPEIARSWRGETSLTLRRPWLVAFAFGLLHGLGFAGALAEAGLPQGDVPLALLSFNLGVEAGQLAFVGAALAAAAVLRRALPTGASWIRRVPGYAVGSLGAFWTLERSAALLFPAP